MSKPLRFTITVTLSLIVLGLTNSAFAQRSSATPKVHLLFVWGTKATDTYWSTLISKKKIEDAFADPQGINLPKNSPHVGTWKSLEGDEAHPEKILRECRSISQKAGPNDAVFVYILCHGAAAVEDDDPTGPRVHGLSPVCKDAKNLDLRKIGIRRSSIMKAMQTRPHRLTVLVTDSCSTLAPPEPKAATVRAMPRGGNPLLREFLLKAKGTLDINSSNPLGGSMLQGELAMGWVPPSKDHPTKEGYLQWAIEDPTNRYSGTVFTNTFVDFAQRRVSKTYSVDEFY